MSCHLENGTRHANDLFVVTIRYSQVATGVGESFNVDHKEDHRVTKTATAERQSWLSRFGEIDSSAISPLADHRV